MSIQHEHIFFLLCSCALIVFIRVLPVNALVNLCGSFDPDLHPQKAFYT
jgi:hypothetical protein